MEDTLSRTIIEELSSELKSKYPDFRGIYLFGSRARGDFNEESDYDLAIIFDNQINWKFEDEISSMIWLKMIKYEIIIDSFVYNLNDILNPITPVRENINKEGVYFG